MTASLLRVVRAVVVADSDPVRQVLFASLARSRRSVRLAWGLHERLGRTWAAAALVGGYGVAAFATIAPPRNRRARVVTLAVHANARDQVARVAKWLGPADCGAMRIGVGVLRRPSGWSALAGLFTSGRLGSVLRVLRVLDRRHGFLVACRSAVAMAWYARTAAILGTGRPGVLVVSSDTNPEEVGCVAAARALGIPQVFVSHAYPTPLSPPLGFTLSILEGQAAVDARCRKGPIAGDVLLAGIEGESAPLDVSRFTRINPAIGIFTPKALSWPGLAALVDECRRRFHARRIVIRWHPSMLEPPRLRERLADLSAVVERAGSTPLAEVARECDWVIADENSNVHLPVLKLGIPTLAVSHLGLYPASRADQYGFIADAIVYPVAQSISDVHPDALAAFYSEEWVARFRRYDASYLRPTATVGAEVRAAVGRLMAVSAVPAADV